MTWPVPNASPIEGRSPGSTVVEVVVLEDVEEVDEVVVRWDESSLLGWRDGRVGGATDVVVDRVVVVVLGALGTVGTGGAVVVVGGLVVDVGVDDVVVDEVVVVDSVVDVVSSSVDPSRRASAFPTRVSVASSTRLTGTRTRIHRRTARSLRGRGLVSDSRRIAHPG